MKVVLLNIVLLHIALLSNAQSADFTVVSPNPSCKGADISFSNTSSASSAYYWDFCLGDFFSEPMISSFNNSDMNSGFGYSIVESDGVYYGFSVDKTDGTIFRLNYGADISNPSPAIEVLGNPGGLLIKPESIDIIKFSGNWYGVIGYEENSGRDVIKLDFGTSLTNMPTASPIDLSSFGYNNRIRGVKLYEFNEELLLVFAHYNPAEIVFVNYRDSFDNTIHAENIHSIATSGRATGFDIGKTSDGNYFIYSVSIINDEMSRIELGNDFLNKNPSVTTYILPDLNFSYDLDLIQEGNNYYAIVGSDRESILIYDLGTMEVAITPNKLEYEIDIPVLVASDPIRYQGSTFIKGVNSSNEYIIKLEAECSCSIGVSEEFEPQGVSYATAGTKTVWLEAYDDFMNSSSVVSNIEINDNQAPQLLLSTDDNICVIDPKVFSIDDLSDTPDLATILYWDVNSDGSIDIIQNSMDQDFGTVSVDYAAYGGAGSYTISVQGENGGGCTSLNFDEITMYDLPDAATEILSSASGYCTYNEIIFSYPALESLPESASLIWNINSELFSDEDIPIYTFGSPGEKQIGLQIVLPNCTTSVYNEYLSIMPGPEVGFSFINNCFGEPIQFNDTSSMGSYYLWDFGDGSPTESSDRSFNPTHTYIEPGLYDVSLTVENDKGCSSSTIVEITISDQNPVFFENSESIANIPTEFFGVDKSLEYDSILSWEWDFASLGTSDQKNSSFTFNSEGDYEVRLTVSTHQGCIETYSETVSTREAEFPSIDFFAEAEDGCIGSSISLTNTSVNANYYEWDFCLSDLADSPCVDTLNLANLSDGFGYKLVNAGSEYSSFIVDKSTSTLFRLDYGPNPNSQSPDITKLDIPVGFLDGGESIDVINFSGNWYGVVGYEEYTGNGITKLDFGSSVKNTPVVSSIDLSSFGFTNRVRSVKLKEYKGDLLMIFAHYNPAEIVFVNYGDSFSNTITSNKIHGISPFSATSRLTGFDLILDENRNFYIYSVSIINNELCRIAFGEDLLNKDPDISRYELADLNFSYDLDIVQEGYNYYALVGSDRRSVLVYDLGNIIIDNYPVNISPLELPHMVSMNSFRYQGISYIKGVNSSQEYTLKFESDCSASITFSESFEPKNLYYQTSGMKEIWLEARKGENSLGLVKEVNIRDVSIPEMEILYPESQCYISMANFISTTNYNVTTYSWDLDGDGLEDSSDPNPTFQYASPGVYDIRLDVVSDAGCTNYVEDEIELYPEPPVPVFEASASTYCTESVVTLTNLTDHTAYDGLVEYHWSITGLSDTTTTGDLAISFAESGVKTISVYSAIPGCESVVAEQTVEIFDAPVTDFSATTVCSGELTAFTNLSETADYIWDFGDGIMSSGTSPEHFYASPGTYDVQLTSTDARGCVSMSSKQVMVSPLPQVSFDYPQVCKGEAALFEDQSFVEQSDVIAWEWFVDDVSVATTQDASIIFETSGTHNVRLVALSQAGCLQSYAEDIEVEDTPDLLIESDGVCLYNMIAFTDITADQSNVQQRIWMVDGAVQSSSDQTLTYTFSTSGVHEVQMIVDQVTGCSGTTKLEIDIPENPQLDFVWDQNCDNEDIIFTDMTSESGNQTIASRVWKVNGEPFGNGGSALLPVLGGGTYEVSLESTTDLGCELALIQTVTLDDAPDIDFTLSNDYGVPPFSLSVSNQTQYASEYIWTLDGAVVSTNANPIITIDSEGVKTLKLVATGSSGCKDSSSTTINSALPIIDLRINEMQLLENGNANNILVNLSNLSNIPVETLSFSIELEDEFVLPEQVYRRIESNEQAVITLNTSIPADYGDLKYLCVSVYSTYDVDDLTPVNNETCQNLATRKPVFEPPFPNPAKDQTVVKAVLPESGEATISVIDMSGQIQVQKFLPKVPAGLNVFEVSLLGLDGGTYMIDISFKGGNYNYRVIKQ